MLAGEGLEGRLRGGARALEQRPQRLAGTRLLGAGTDAVLARLAPGSGVSLGEVLFPGEVALLLWLLIAASPRRMP